MKKWYLQTWFIAILFAGWIFGGVPLIVGIVLLVIRTKEMKPIYDKINAVEDAEQYATIIRKSADTYSSSKRAEADTYSIKVRSEVEEYSQKINGKCTEITKDMERLKVEKRALQAEMKTLEKDVFVKYTEVYVDEKITSEEYKNKLSMLKVKETEFIKSDKALLIRNKDRMKKVINDNAKQILRCFNAEAANIISSVSAKNIDALRNKMQRAFEALNKIFAVDEIELAPQLLEMKLEELTLLYQFEVKKEQEREEQKAIREQMLEEEKVRREIEREKTKIEKEEQQFKNEVSKLMGYLQKATDIEKQLYVDKIRELEDKLKLLEKDRENVLQREQNTRAGFVYVISNIGSFGEDVYKIGMTRRLEPMDRVKELGDASVPFEFDVHAMIFSEDAPTLETTLHNTFRGKEINKVNLRKEFFGVTLEDIEKVVKENHNATVTFTRIAEAAQYRESLRMAEAG